MMGSSYSMVRGKIVLKSNVMDVGHLVISSMNAQVASRFYATSMTGA